MIDLTPYLLFDGDARAAMTFYRDVFGGELDIVTFDHYGLPDSSEEGSGVPPDGVMHARLVTDAGLRLMGSDLPPGETGSTPNGHLCISGDEVETVTGWFEALAEGGNVDVPLERQVWGDHYGQVKDRFGVNWMFNVADQDTSPST